MKPGNVLSKDEIAHFTRRSDLLGAWMVLSNWALIGLVLLVTALWTNPATILLSVLLLGGRQLGLSVLMHEAGHKTLFHSDKLNAFIGQWL